MKFLLIFFFFLFHFQSVRATLSPEAQTYLNKIPEKKLTIPFIIKAALKNSSAFKLLGYDYALVNSEEQSRFDSLTDTVLVGSTQYLDDNSVQTMPFRPLRTKNQQWSLGLEKKWETGTKTSLSWIQDDTNLEFGRNLGPFGNSFLRNFKQSAIRLQLEQNLLKDIFGYSFRNRRQGARHRAKALELKVRDDIENLILVFIGDFYRSWLLQKQVNTLKNRLQRQKKLLKILIRRSRKGAVEKPDLIGLQALMTSTSARLKLLKTDMTTRWETLIINLELPDLLLRVNAMDVPMKIDKPVTAALKVCDLENPEKTANIQALEKKLAAFDSDFKASKNESLPDLKLIAGYQGNSIDNSSSVNFRNVLRGFDDNGFGRGPAWNLGVKLFWPLNNSGARSQRTVQFIEKEKASAQLRIAKDNLKTKWRDKCRKLKVEKENLEVYRQMINQQRKRLAAEEKRFSLGRINVNQWVNAEDDLDQWEFNKNQKSVEIRQLAWEIQKISGEMYKNLSPFIEAMMTGRKP